MTTLYNGQLFIQGLTLYTAAQGLGVTSSDTIVSVLDSITNNASQKVMLEIGSCNMNLGNKGSVYKYLVGMSNSTYGLGGEFHIQSLASLTRATYISGTPITRFMINAIGNVGIGTNTPQYKLDVAGSIGTSGDIITSGKISTSGIFYGNGSGLTNISYATTAGTALSATYANTAGAIGTLTTPLVLSNMSAATGASTYSLPGHKTALPIEW